MLYFPIIYIFSAAWQVSPWYSWHWSPLWGFWFFSLHATFLIFLFLIKKRIQVKPWLYSRNCLWIHSITFPFMSLQDQLKITPHLCSVLLPQLYQVPLKKLAAESSKHPHKWLKRSLSCRVTRCLLHFCRRWGDSLIEDSGSMKVFIKSSKFHSLSLVNEWCMEELLFLLGTASRSHQLEMMWELPHSWILSGNPWHQHPQTDTFSYNPTPWKLSDGCKSEIRDD